MASHLTLTLALNRGLRSRLDHRRCSRRFRCTTSRRQPVAWRRLLGLEPVSRIQHGPHLVLLLAETDAEAQRGHDGKDNPHASERLRVCGYNLTFYGRRNTVFLDERSCCTLVCLAVGELCLGGWPGDAG